MRAWIALIAAVALEVFGTMTLKLASLGEFPLGAALTGLCIAGSYVLLAQAFKRIPVAVAFAVWEAAGLALVTLLGALLLGEALTPLRSVALLGLVAGAWLLHRGTRHPAHHPA
ncbi:DMT family transporter [Deinococcus koreensis]|uniref:Spermidine export protein MdtJ n=1 Tax=Deinococcus koreensis TaxID=2054903 RepID=A0A2K3UUD4_9DEIO|nr:SMR family transporter [Deinococcus koreensis]PNY80142.1 LuxR family transcriptional regulator [Deinococcus koreensis]